VTRLFPSVCMDEKTEELRDIFTDVAESDTVTERQAETRGTLLGDGDVHERLVDVVGQMRERYDFGADLGDDDLARVVRAYDDGEDDDAIADRLDVSRSTVERARLDLHLVRERDRDAPFALDTLRERLDDGATVASVADDLGVSESTVRRYRRVLAATERARRANERYREEFDAVLADVESDGITDGVREDGLEEATEDSEADVSL